MNGHGKITKLSIGRFAINEMAIYGSTCDALSAFIGLFVERLAGYQLAYVDESHSSDKPKEIRQLTIHEAGGVVKTHHYSPLEKQTLLRQADLVLINGNHFEGQSQLIIYEAAKENSLLKRKDQLNNVFAFIGPKESFEGLQQLGLDLDGVAQFEDILHPNFWDILKQRLTPAPLSALILTGGKSVRMGTDKSLIRHHQLPQYLHLKEQCTLLNLPTLLSCRLEQKAQFDWPTHDIIEDRIADIGPLAGLISAWMRYPDQAWLTIACDMPNLSTKSIAQLIQQRTTSAMATTICLTQDQPEPMLTIWEPKAYSIIMQALSMGLTCPRKILQKSNVHSVMAEYPIELFNANTPEDLSALKP
jgi:molybdenum cofactor guanylyltransferase